MDVLEEKRIKNVDQDEIEIRLSEIILFLQRNRWKMVIGGAIGFIVGMLYAFSLPNMYTVQVAVMPEFRSKGTSGLSSLTSDLLGLGSDMSSSSEPTIRPDLYPNVLESVPFALDMLKQPVYSRKLNSKTTLEEFINKTSTVSWIDQIFNFFTIKNEDDKVIRPDFKNNSQTIEVTKEQDGLIKVVQGSVSSAYDKKTGILTIKAVEPDPLVAASVARLSLDYLTNYITAYRTDKARKRVIFLTQQVKDAKERYQSAEYALSEYRDRNRSLYLNTAKLDEQRLQANYLLEQSVYSDLAKQLEQAKIKVNEETPTFKTLDPPIVPLRKSGPKRTLTMVGFLILGVIISLILVFIRHIMRRGQPA